MKHTRKRALLSAVAMLIVSTVVLSSATFAWFTAGKTASVSAITVNVTTPSSLSISPTATGPWDNLLSTADIQGATSEGNVLSTTLSAVSVKPDESMDFFEGTLATNFTLTATSLTSANYLNKIVTFKFYLKSAEAKTVSMTGSSITGVTTATYLAMQRGSVENDASSQVPVYVAGDGTAIEYDALVHEFATPTSAPGGILPAGANTSSISQPAKGITDLTIALSANQVTQVIVYMWLEGQDPDCVNGLATTGGTQLDFAFSIT